MPPFSVIRSSSSGASELPAALWGPAQRGGACAAQAFCLRQTLGAGPIYSARARQVHSGVPGRRTPRGAMREAAKLLEFEYAAILRDKIVKLRGE